MTLPTSMTTADRDRQFDDWGETITFRQVTQTFDTQTQQVSEQPTDTILTAVVGSAAAKPATNTAGRHLIEEIDFLIKAEELPGTSPVPDSRIIYKTVEYDVLSFTITDGGLTYTLQCRRTK